MGQRSHFIALFASVSLLISFQGVRARTCTTPLTGCGPRHQEMLGCSLWSAPDDCDCQHWHCDTLPNHGGGGNCPSGEEWHEYVNSDGETMCIGLFSRNAQWNAAAQHCNSEYNSDLLNVRQLEKFSERDPVIEQQIVSDIQNLTNGEMHWSGLRMIDGKLYWDAELPSPDRDLTVNRYYGYDRRSSSTVMFDAAHWVIFNSDRQCVSYRSISGEIQNRAHLQPEFCTALYPFICYKQIEAITPTYYQPSNSLLCGDEPGWFGSAQTDTCYKYFGDLLTYSAAEQACVNNNGKLADPRNNLNQRFLYGILSELGNGTAPTAIHTGMKEASTGLVRFSDGDLVPSSALGALSITDSPSANKGCGMLWNKYFSTWRDNVDMFGDCTETRPFICTRDLTTPVVAADSVSVVVIRESATLTCSVTGLDDVSGTIVWMKDHNYFPTQEHSRTIPLTSDGYKLLTNDLSNRTVGNGELAGIYACEFWQTYPREQYKSPGLSITFNDTTSLRMSTTLNEVPWLSELEGFNYRVSQRDELSTEVQRVYDILLAKVQSTLANLTREDVSYGVNIIQLRQTKDGKTEVDYRITMSGEQVARSKNTNNATSQHDADYLQNVVTTLESADLVSNSSTGGNNSITGQFTCLATTVYHPTTNESYMLPMRQSNTTKAEHGDCLGVRQAMLKATCVYSEVTRKSTWQTTFLPCDVDCLQSSVTHSVTDETFKLRTALNGQQLSLLGLCGSRSQVLVIAQCTGSTWETTEKECTLSCPISELSHSQWTSSPSQSEYVTGQSYEFSIPCNGVNKTVMTAYCNENTQWENITQDLCVPTCESRDVQHPIGQGWTLNRTELDQSVSLNGLCNNVSVTLGTAMCEGDMAAGGTWKLTYADCQASCPPQSAQHPVTGQSWNIGSTRLNQNRTITGRCNNVTTQMGVAVCSGDLSTGGVWDFIFSKCEAFCPARDVVHPTGATWRLKEKNINTNHTLRGICDNVRMTLARASCRGDYKNGGEWTISFIPCEAKCAASNATHPIGTTWPLGIADFGQIEGLTGLCNNQTTVLAEATCVGDLKRGGEWNVTYAPCEAQCNTREVTHDIGQTWTLEAASLGVETNLSGFCDNQTETLGRAECVGDHVYGAEWDIKYKPCEVTCSPTTFTHPVTEVTVNLDEGQIDEEQIIEFTCDGSAIPVQVICEGTASSGAAWKLDQFPECSPVCPETQWYDSVTQFNYTVSPAALNSHSTVKAYCGGSEMVRFLAECHGDIVTGVFWQNEEFDCSPSCNQHTTTHPDTGALLVFPSTDYDELYTIRGQCSGRENVTLASARCGGSRAEVPSWYDVRIIDCIGFCEPSNVSYPDGRPSYRLPEGRIGDRELVNSTCALRAYTEISAECSGSAEDGGEWAYSVNSCDVDTACPTQQFVHPDTKLKLFVNQTEPGPDRIEALGTCQGEEVVMMSAVCEAVLDGSGQWVDANYTECVTDMTDQLANLMDFYKDNPLALTELTAELSENLENATDEQIGLMVDIVEFIADPATPKELVKEGEFFFDIVNNMMDAPLEKEKSRRRRETGEDDSKDEDADISPAQRLALSVEDFVSSAKINEARITLERKNLLVEVLNTEKLGSHEKPSLMVDDLQVSLPYTVANGYSFDNKQVLKGLFITQSSWDRRVHSYPSVSEGSKVSFVKYASSALFGDGGLLLGDSVFSASVSGKEIKDTKGAIQFTMQIPDNISADIKPVCSYYNFTLSDWSTDGCHIVEVENSSVTCQCNHLTNFAILMDITGQEQYISEVHHLALSIITIVGLCISIVALSLHLISFLFIVKLRQNVFQKVLANLAFAILVSNIVFLAGIDKTGNENACIAVAALLHYFILASFCWMFVEAFMQYRRFVKVFGTHVTHILLKAGIPAWVTPIIPVSILLIIDPQLYRGGERFCWMKPEPLYYSFLLPIGCVILANIVLFALILRGLTCARPASLRTNKSEAELRMMYFKAGLAVFTLLGLTWIFGFLAISDARLAFQYLFCITNAFQGLVIFLLHNIRDPKVQAWWRKTLHLKPLATKSTSSMRTAGFKSKGSYSITNTSSLNDSVTDSSPGQESDKSSSSPEAANKNLSDKDRSGHDSVKSTTPLTSKYLQLEKSKLMHSSIESDASGTSTATANSGV